MGDSIERLKLRFEGLLRVIFSSGEVLVFMDLRGSGDGEAPVFAYQYLSRPLCDFFYVGLGFTRVDMLF